MATKFLTFGAAAAFGGFLSSFKQSNNHAASCAGRKEAYSTKYQPFVLGEVLNLAEDVAVFRFLLNNPDDVFDLVPCSTLQAHFKEGTNIIDQPMRFYTPITPNGTKGYFDLLVRKQRPGRFTEHLFSMNVGDSLLFRVLQYKLSYKKDRWDHAGFIAGGTGICPILQFMNAALEDPTDKLKMRLLFANRSENTILLKGMLDEIERKHKDRLQLYYCVDRLQNHDLALDPAYKKGPNRLQLNSCDRPEESPEGKKYFHGFTGYLDVPMLQASMPPPGDRTIVLVCGPDMMMVKVVGAAPKVLKAMSSGNAYQPSGAILNNAADVSGYLGSMGFTKDMVYRF